MSTDALSDPESLSVAPLRVRLQSMLLLLRLGISLVWRSSRAMTVTIFAVMVLRSLLAPLQLFLTATTIDSIIRHLGYQDVGGGWSMRFSPYTWMAMTVTVILLGQMLEPVTIYLQTMLGDYTTFHVGDRLLAATNRWYGLARFENPQTADDLNLAAERAGNAGNDLLMQGGPLIPALLTALTLCITLGALNPLVPVLLLLAAVPKVVGAYGFAEKTSSHIAWQVPYARRLMYTRDMPVYPREARDYRLFELGERTLQRYDLIWTEVTQSLNEVRHRLLKGQVRGVLLSELVSGGAVLFIIWRATTGEISIGQVALFTGAVLMLNERVREIGMMIGYIPRILAFLPSLQRVLDAPSDLPVPSDPIPLQSPLKEGIAFHSVSFTYPDTEQPVLRGISFSLAPGERLALVGHNGAGKTTIVKLMLRLYDPDEGTITLNGVDIRDYDPAELRTAYSVIFQDFGRYDFTVRDNIALGDSEAHPNDDELLRAAAKAGAENVVANLPDGLDTLLGLRFGGRDLSGGEWQKIALARAFVREAPILVLDEPTAALDVRAEYEVYQRFVELTRDRATLLISHRFSTVRMADRVLVLDGSRIVEEGSHRELMRREGVYHRLYTAQAKHYVDSDGVRVANGAVS